MGDDAGAAPDEVGSRMLVDVNVPAMTQQQVGCEQATQRAADDDRALRVHCCVYDEAS